MANRYYCSLDERTTYITTDKRQRMGFLRTATVAMQILLDHIPQHTVQTTKQIHDVIGKDKILFPESNSTSYGDCSVGPHSLWQLDSRTALLLRATSSHQGKDMRVGTRVCYSCLIDLYPLFHKTGSPGSNKLTRRIDPVDGSGSSCWNFETSPTLVRLCVGFREGEEHCERETWRGKGYKRW